MMRFLPKPNRAQDGIAILLTVMLVSAIAVISLTVAFFIMQEIRNTRSTALTEPAIIAAESAGEQGVYQIKRSTFGTDCTSADYTNLDGGSGSSSTKIKKCISTQPAVFQLRAGEDPKVLYLYDVNNMNNLTVTNCMEETCSDNDQGSGGGAQLFTSIVVTYMTGSFNVSVSIDTLDGVHYDDGTVTPGSTATFPIDRDILGSSDERLRITLTPSSGTATLQVSTAGLHGPGLPDYQTVSAEGCVALVNISDCDTNSETYKRRINVTLPR